MTRQREDRVHARPIDGHARTVAGPRRGRHGRGPAELQPRRARRARPALPRGPPGRGRRRPQRRGTRRPAGPEDPARPLRRRAGHLGDRRADPHHRRGRAPAPTTACRRRTSTSPTTCARATGCSSTTATSRSSPSRSRTARTSSATSPRAARSATTRACRCPAWTVSVPAHVGQGRRGSASSRCAWASTSSRCPSSATPEDVKLVHRVMDEVGIRRAGDRQDREARGGGAARGDRRSPSTG